MDTGIKIGEMAQIIGVPVVTLRYWTNEGLIPVRVVSPKGTRWYDKAVVIDTVNGWKSKPRL